MTSSQSKNDIDLSIVIPCYNEEKNVPLVLARFKSAIGKQKIEVIMVDNGSIDNTGRVLKNLIKAYPFARIVTVKKNEGYGWGILSGLAECRGKFLGWTHADMQTDPKDVVKSLSIISDNGFNENIFVKGVRRNRPFLDRAFSSLMGIYVSMILFKSFNEVNAQPTIFSRKLYKQFIDPPKDFSLDLYIYYLAKISKFKIIRFPVQFPPRLHGESSWNFSFANRLKLTRRAMSYTKELRKKIHDLHRSPHQHDRTA
jgi:glycosyltransferase involved in cell wall biosynthesis